jgi:uncharacterized protein (DUF952 family)
LHRPGCLPYSRDEEGMNLIYHIVQEKEYLNRITGDRYIPASIAVQGFVHCALEDSVISVANDFFSHIADPLLLLQIDPLKLKSQTRYEAAAPDKNAQTQHVDTSSIFPHVYGPIDNSAIEGIGLFQKNAGRYLWPKEFISSTEYLRRKNISPQTGKK